jgi:hypothetical protein
MIYVLLFVYAVLSCYTIYRICQSVILTRQQKIINIVISLLMPLIWYYLIRGIIFPKHKLMTKEERERLIRLESGYRQERRNDH